jgi:hypothetical protein
VIKYYKRGNSFLQGLKINHRIKQGQRGIGGHTDLILMPTNLLNHKYSLASLDSIVHKPVSLE